MSPDKWAEVLAMFLHDGVNSDLVLENIPLNKGFPNIVQLAKEVKSSSLYPIIPYWKSNQRSVHITAESSYDSACAQKATNADPSNNRMIFIYCTG